MTAPIDDQGRYKVVLPFDAAVRLGFSSTGAFQLVNALPLSYAGDRVRLVEVARGAAAMEKSGSIEYLTPNLQSELLLLECLGNHGISLSGRQCLVKGLPVLDRTDCARIANFIARSAPGT